MSHLVDAVKNDRVFHEKAREATVIRVNYRWDGHNGVQEARLEAEVDGQVVRTRPLWEQTSNYLAAGMVLTEETKQLRQYLGREDILFDVWYEKDRWRRYHFGELPRNLETYRELVAYLTIDKSRVMQ